MISWLRLRRLRGYEETYKAKRDLTKEFEWVRVSGDLNCGLITLSDHQGFVY